jgi:hypothetical protein
VCIPYPVGDRRLSFPVTCLSLTFSLSFRLASQSVDYIRWIMSQTCLIILPIGSLLGSYLSKLPNAAIFWDNGYTRHVAYSLDLGRALCAGCIGPGHADNCQFTVSFPPEYDRKREQYATESASNFCYQTIGKIDALLGLIRRHQNSGVRSGKDSLAAMLTTWCSKCIEPLNMYNETLSSYTLTDERTFRDLTFKWTMAWDLKVRQSLECTIKTRTDLCSVT